MEKKYIKDINGQRVLPITSMDAVIDSSGNSAETLLENLRTAYNQLSRTVRGKANIATTLAGYGITDSYTKAAVDSMVAALTQSNIVVTETLPATGNTNTIYRVKGAASYSDNMYYGGQWIELATYNNATDTVPTKNSGNLVTSGGVFNHLDALDVSELNQSNNTPTPYNSLENALAAIPAEYQKGGMMIKYLEDISGVYRWYKLLKPTWSTVVTDWSYMPNDVIVPDNPEFIRVYTDSKGKFLWGIKHDGSIEWGKGVPYPVKKAIQDIYNYIKKKNTEIDGRLDSFENMFNVISSTEYMLAFTDEEGKFVFGVTVDGKLKTWKGDYTTEDMTWLDDWLNEYDDPEGRFEITKDRSNHLVSYRDSKGVKHENAGIVATTADVDSLNAKVANILRLNLTTDELKRISRQNYIIINTNPSYGEVFIGNNNNSMNGPTNTKNVLIGMHNIQNATGYPDRNVAVGYHALFRGFEPKQCIAIGAESQDNVSYGVGNTAVGYSSLRCQKFDDYGDQSVVGETVQENTAFGFDCMYYVYGDHNTAIGAHALEGDTYGAKGNRNIAIGYSAGKYINDENDTLFIDNRDRESRANEKSKALIFGHFADNIADQFVKVNGKFGCNGATPQPAVSANADATDLESAIALLNQIKNALISCGIMR